MNLKKDTYLLLLFVLCNTASATEWFSYKIWNNNEETTSSSLEITYQGQRYNPPQEITEMSQIIDRSSPKNLLKSLFWAANHLDGELYNNLFAPGEQKQSFANNPKFKLIKLELCRIIQYGEYSILELSATYSSGRSLILWPVRKIDGKYYATESLLANDNAFDFINYYYAFSFMVGIPNEQESTKTDFDLKGFLYMTNYPFADTNSSPPLILRFQGVKYGTNFIINKWPLQIDQDLSSPAGTLASAIAALNSGDINRYSGLLFPNERTNIIRGGSLLAVGKTWDEWMRSKFQNESKSHRPSAVRLNAEISYAFNTTALIYEDAERPAATRDVLYLRKDGSSWYISHKLEETANLFPKYLGFGKWSQTKMFPHF